MILNTSIRRENLGNNLSFLSLKMLKYPDLIHYRKSYEWEKCKYVTFISRVIYYGYDLEIAVSPKTFFWRHRIKSEIREDGRVCTMCRVFKLWDQFSIDKNNKSNGHSTECLQCRREKKKEYRAKSREKDNEYRGRKRTLEIWSYIAFLSPIIVDGVPREDVREVIGYKFKRGYEIKSVHTGEISRLDAGDNVPKWNCKKFYRIDKPVELVAKKKEIIQKNSDLFDEID